MENKETTRICVINHLTHKVYLLTVDRDTIIEKYHDEEAFIKEKLGYTDKMLEERLISWDWFTNIEWVDENSKEVHYKVVIWADVGNDFIGSDWKYVDLSAPMKTREEAEEFVRIISSYNDIWELDKMHDEGFYTNLKWNEPQIIETEETIDNPWKHFGGKPLNPKS